MGHTAEQKEYKDAREEALHRLRHSCAHVMAQAVQELFPGTKLAIGPTIEDGFYYDFDSPHRFTPEDLSRIEERMRQVAKGNHAFVRSEKSKEEALRFFHERQERYKIEIIEGLGPGEPVSFFQHDSFIDLCRGPHLEKTGELKHFKLLNVSGAYWRGDEKNTMLQRVYGTAWPTKEELETHLKRLEEAKKRDHRKLGVELGLFSVHEEIGGGLIHWHPKGASIRMMIEDLWRKEHLKNGYHLVYTPHIASEEIYKISGHLEAYSELMYGAMDVEGRPFRAKPMNCPGHIMIYKSGLHSYRELPLRYAELGTVYRFEKSGVLHGLLRVRGFTIDDAHIFLTLDGLEEELKNVLSLARRYLGMFGFNDLNIMLSTRPEKYVGSEENWEKATAALKASLDHQGLPYEIDEGGGAFYGPKIDVKVKDSLGRLWQCSTVQLDFNLPQRFKVTYRASDSKDHNVVMIHRALLGSLERFFGVLIEHYGGAFPLWLAPVQVKFVSVGDDTASYVREAADLLRRDSYRVELDLEPATIGAKIRNATLEKVPVIAVIGPKEKESRTVTLRARDGANLGAVPLTDLPILLAKLARSGK
ncbi:MAG: threonine--tRNA ligase [Elusimicrobia bacterium]|nr:threonine--tRNA ligase [Elusimicrobiota bacterium]